MLKKIISKLMPKKALHKLPFWHELERNQKIKRATQELDDHYMKVCINNPLRCEPTVALSDFEQLYKLAKIQQSLLTIKNGKFL